MAPITSRLGFLAAPRTVKSAEPVANIFVSSLELDMRDESSAGLYTRGEDVPALSPIQQHDVLAGAVQKRADSTFVPGQGTKAPDTFNNGGFFALFAILGAAMVLASLWFFFWAKNGGFKWQQGDWDDYKSTVLRRKGPDGKTLSNATKSTKLGGGTIAGTQRYAWQKNMARSVVSKDEKGRKGILGKRGWAKTHSITYSDDFTDSLGTRTVTDEMAEVRSEPDFGHHSKRYRDRDVRQYKKEKPARVGGLNRAADGSNFDYTNTDRSDVMTESVLTESSEQPMIPKKKDDNKRKEKERAERKAREEAARMERRWKREAEEAAAALARESERIPPPPAAKKSAGPSKNPSSAQKPRRDRGSRSNSPKKRDFSYTNGPESEVLSTAYTQSTSQRTSSYYDEYRPRASERYSSEYGHTARSSRQSSPRKKQGRGAPRSGGYRRGNTDSDLE
ncbi:hypothetical protein BST61_czeina37g000160 [Lecanosticta acicola]|uniref:Uncharacterized protein n=1 Tax=Lecanosticta acicola TaxID=111012 RepID=A0AAI8Z0S1_9PEZI|nr:hypothetical protein BST61_czeina37g000160 [Lecanosticta acicola]